MTSRASLRSSVARIPVIGPLARRVVRAGRSPLRVQVGELQARFDVVNHIAHFDHDAVTSMRAQLADIDRHLPQVLNAISSASGTSRRLIRQTETLIREIEATRARLVALEGQVGGHAQTQAWLIERVETVRKELMYEFRYSTPSGGAQTAPAIEPRVVDQRAVDDAIAAGELRLNLGCGHLPIEGYVNVDMRELPGVDVVAPADDLPFEPGSVQEIFSAHFLEHFPEEQLKRQLLPAWVALLADGGNFRAVVPDFVSMVQAWEDGKVPFPTLRSVLFGGQEYEGDFHFTMFTPDSLDELLTAAGLTDVTVVERGRPNGDCLEMEIAASKPARR